MVARPRPGDRQIPGRIGALFLGQQSGRLAAKVLAGVKPSALPIEKTAIRHTVFAKTPEAKPSAPAAPFRKWRIFLVRYSDASIAEEATKGVQDALSDAKLVEGRDYTLQMKSAQGDIITLNTIFDAIKSEGPDLVITFSTPTLQAALHKFDKTPIVFSVVADAVVAGAGALLRGWSLPDRQPMNRTTANAATSEPPT